MAAAIVAAHGACQTWVMYHSWPDGPEPVPGLGAYDADLVVISVAVVLLVGIGAAAAVEVWPEPAVGWRGALPARPWWVVAGVLVAVLLPPAWDAGRAGTVPDGSAVWMYALPWGTGLASVGWLRGRSATVTSVTVMASAVVCAVYTVSIHVMVPPTVPVGD